MSKIKDTFFGGAEKEAGRKAREELAKGREAISAGAERARGDLMSGFNQAQESRRAGLEGARSLFEQAVPQQANLFQQGNVAAQRAIRGGLAQQKNALMGRATNFDRFAPTQQRTDFSFLQQQLPQTSPVGQAAPQEASPAVDVEQLRALLSGNAGRVL